MIDEKLYQRVEEMAKRIATLESRIIAETAERQEWVDKSKRLEAEDDGLKDVYQELIMEVAKKYPGETRHQTAKRYIKERETHLKSYTAQATTKKDTP